jgi:hypothetical protein
MPLSSETQRDALAATREAMRLLELADRSVYAAQSACHGDLLELAERLSRHLSYVCGVAALLGHEIEQQNRSRTSSSEVCGLLR